MIASSRCVNGCQFASILKLHVTGSERWIVTPLFGDGTTLTDTRNFLTRP
jgi:hypothetical protein